MKGLIRAAGFLIISLVIGEIVQRLLRSRVGKKATTAVGHPELSTCEGSEGAKKDARRAVGLVQGLLWRAEEAPPTAVTPPAVVPPLPRWALLASEAGEMLLAAGGVLKTAADFIQQDERLRRRIARFAGG